MKNTIKTFAILFLLINTNCKAQQMVQTTKDVSKLKTNEQQFINKPLKNLLKEIKPEIKIGYGSNDEGHSYFSFRFTTFEQREKKQGSKEDRVSLYVYVKEGPIDWDFDKRPIGKEYEWTKEDLVKYGNLTVIRIKIIQSAQD
ncbi:hypothetical protein [Flavobacterium sp. 140616W15]|uniref:hypothetical protein n=1 Tax=Flavobacterium sp. 140616W15 TaxID=2478552 RepID=UPI000F0D1AEC|nr:hypothetical protein [Flavobacterium sp. 140616W15]AYN05054.1 hypothetical protein EAG11_13530 [Flavobacterium sp. 140616W15]